MHILYHTDRWDRSSSVIGLFGRTQEVTCVLTSKACRVLNMTRCCHPNIHVQQHLYRSFPRPFCRLKVAEVARSLEAIPYSTETHYSPSL